MILTTGVTGMRGSRRCSLPSEHEQGRAVIGLAPVTRMDYQRVDQNGNLLEEMKPREQVGTNSTSES